MSDFWRGRQQGEAWACPWCPALLEEKISKTDKNPDRAYVFCDKKKGGCGMYSFLDAKPNAKYKPKAVVGEKRECPAPDNELECLRKRVQDLEADNRRLLSIAEKLVDLFARE